MGSAGFVMEGRRQSLSGAVGTGALAKWSVFSKDIDRERGDSLRFRAQLARARKKSVSQAIEPS